MNLKFNSAFNLLQLLLVLKLKRGSIVMGHCHLSLLNLLFELTKFLTLGLRYFFIFSQSSIILKFMLSSEAFELTHILKRQIIHLSFKFPEIMDTKNMLISSDTQAP